MPSPLIHIGFPKTATTWFQESLFPHVTNITLIEKDVINRNIIKPNAFDFDKKNAANNFKPKEKNYRIVLSSERLVGTFNRGWLNGFQPKELANRLKTLFPTATIAVFIRKQEDAIASAYQQYLKNGGTFGINKYLRSSNFFLFSLDHLRYFEIINYYCELFGRDNIKIYLFEDFKINPMEFSKNFASENQLDCLWEKISFTPKNESPPKLAIPIIKFTNRFYYRGYPFKQYFFPIPHSREFAIWLSQSSLLGKKATKEQILGKDNLANIADYYRESNNNLINKLGIEAIKKYHYSL